MKHFLIPIIIFLTIATGISEADAETVKDVGDSLKLIENSMSRVENILQKAKKIMMKKRFDAMNRFLNGVYLLKNGREEDAAALFMSLVNHPKLGKEATFYYAEAMYRSQNYLIAAEYYKKVMVQKWNPDFRSKAIKRIFEISMKSGTVYRSKMSEIISIINTIVKEVPELAKSPQVIYASGKYNYYLATAELKKSKNKRNYQLVFEKLNKALYLFNQITPTKDSENKLKYPLLYPQSVYYAGSVLVQLARHGAQYFYQGDKKVDLSQIISTEKRKEKLLIEAIRKFAILAVDKDNTPQLLAFTKVSQGKLIHYKPQNKDETTIQNLARLAIGRIFYEMGITMESIKWYKLVDENSDLYEDALFEMAWVHVQENTFAKAIEIFSILEARNKNSIYLPRAKLLLGYLKVRKEKWLDANKSFTKTSLKYQKVHDELKKLMDKKIDPFTFFRQINSRNKDKNNESDNKDIFEKNYNIPEEAVPIFKNNQNFMKAILIADNIKQIKKSLETANNYLQLVRRNLRSSSKIAIFPVLKKLRTRTYEYEFKNIKLRRQLVALAKQKLFNVLSSKLINKFKQYEKQRKKLEKKIANMPKSTDSLNRKLRNKISVYKQYTVKVENLQKDLKTAREFLKGLYKYYQDLPAEKKKKAKNIIARIHNEADNLKAALKMAKKVRAKIIDASLDVGLDDTEMAAESLVRRKYRKVVARQIQLFSSRTSSMNSEQKTLYDQILSHFEKSIKIEDRMFEANSKMMEIASFKLRQFKQSVQDEKKKLELYHSQYSRYNNRTGRLAKSVSQNSLSKVADKFKKIVMEADLGLVDVSWSKRAKTRSKWAKLVRESRKITEELKQRYSNVIDNKIKIDKKEYTDPFAAKKSTGKKKSAETENRMPKAAKGENK
ncbi:MAG: tetratricopeptide repeat protein [Myxococcota bacterium]